MKKRLLAAAFVAALGGLATMSSGDAGVLGINAAIVHHMYPPGCSLDDSGATVCRASPWVPAPTPVDVLLGSVGSSVTNAVAQ